MPIPAHQSDGNTSPHPHGFATLHNGSNPGLAKSGLTRLIPTSLCSAMPRLNRRQFIHGGAVACAYAAMTGQLLADYKKLKIGVTDWNLRHEAKPTSVALAKSLGFDGVEISLGRARGRLPL